MEYIRKCLDFCIDKINKMLGKVMHNNDINDLFSNIQCYKNITKAWRDTLTLKNT